MVSRDVFFSTAQTYIFMTLRKRAPDKGCLNFDKGQSIFSTFMPASVRSRRILIVDDEVNVAQTLELVFRGCGYETRAAFSAEQAIEIIATWQPDLAILDVMLPKMNGIEFGGVLKANYPDCQVLLASGHPGTSELLEMAWRKGNNFEILAKPLHPAVILELVANMLPKAKDQADA
jgi:CheY-like chemotaxis protein